MLAVVIEIVARFGIQRHNAEPSLFKRNSGYCGSFRSESAELFQHIFYINFIIVISDIRHAEHKRSLRQVRQDDVRLCAERRHTAGEFLRKARIELAAVRHNRIDDYLVFRRAEVVKYPADDLKLTERAEIAGINCVKTDVFLFPMLRYREHIVRKIAERKAFELRMSRKDCRRHNRGFNAHRGNYRKGNCQRAFADARYILDCEYSFHFLPPW